MYIAPMLLQKVDKPFNDDNWITELKMDGMRLILSKFNDRIRLYSRHRNEVTSKFPELLNINIPNGTILDGELIVTGEDGKPDFELLMERFLSKNIKTPIQYVVFDIIYYKGEKVKFPLIDRKKLLEKVIPDNHYNIVLSKWIYGNGINFFNLVKEQDLEGSVQKRIDSLYFRNRRTADWRKVINYKYEIFTVLGVSKGKFGVLLGNLEGKPLGTMEFMNPTDRRFLYNNLKALKTNESKKYIYMQPKLKCKVKFRNYTKKGKLRIPSLVEWVS